MDPPELFSGSVQTRTSSPDFRPLLLVVEGRHDVEFLRRLSANLARDDPSLPDLGTWEREGRLVFVPVGGGDVLAWSERFSPLCLAEFHLFDREIPPETAVRIQAASRVNARLHCHAVVTTKRSLENYLHPAALVLAGGVHVEFDDEASVAACVARQQFTALGFKPGWDQFSRRTRARFTNRAKRWLNTIAVEHLSRELLAERDPQGEVLNWLRTIARLWERAQIHGSSSPDHFAFRETVLSRRPHPRRQPHTRRRLWTNVMLALAWLFVPVVPGCDRCARAPTPIPPNTDPPPPVPTAPGTPPPPTAPSGRNIQFQGLDHDYRGSTRVLPNDRVKHQKDSHD